MKNQEPTIADVLETTTDILEAMNIFSSGVDERFNKIDERFEKIDERFEKIENDLKIVKSTMVTKNYLDEKLYNLRGDLTEFTRKEDNKVKEEIAEILVKKKILSTTEKKALFKIPIKGFSTSN